MIDLGKIIDRLACKVLGHKTPLPPDPAYWGRPFCPRCYKRFDWPKFDGPNRAMRNG